MEFGLGQRITGRVSHLRGVELRLRRQRDPLPGSAQLPRQLDQKLPGLGWKKIAAISGKVEVPGLIRFRLANPGAALPEVEIAYEIVPGDAQHPQHPRLGRDHRSSPTARTIRDKIREHADSPGADPPVQPLRRRRTVLEAGAQSRS